MKGHLIQIDARVGSGAATRYLASADDPLLCHLNGQQWVPAIASLPSLRYDFFGGDFNGAITTPSASFSVAIEGITTFTAMRWSGGRVRIYTGNIGDAWGSFTLRFDGRINAEPTLGAGIASFEAGPDDSWLDKPLLTLFAGTGGAEGPADLTGTPKPLALGACRFAPGVLIDATNNVYCVSAYAVQGVTAAYDRVVSLGASTGDYASLAALIAAAIPSGSWGTCKALGLARLGAPADGLVSFDVSGDNAGAVGYARKPGAMIRRVAEIAGGTVDTANLTALDTARSYNLALVLTAQTTARETIQSLADSVCAVAGVTWTGTLFASPLGYTASSLSLKSDGTALPPVASVEVRPVAAPFWRLATEAEPTWVVHDPGNVSSEYNLRGLYSAARVYRLDDVVTSADGSTWLYINSTSAAGNAPPAWPTTSNSYWTYLDPATNAAWSLVSGTGKPSDNAGTTLVLTALGTNPPTFRGNTATRSGGTDGFTSAAVFATPLIGNAFVAAEINQTSGIYTMVALDDDATNFARDGGGGFRAYVQYQASSGLWEAYVNGSISSSGTAASGLTGLLKIVYDGVNHIMVAGATTLATIATTANQTLYAKWALYDASVVLSGLQAGYATDNAWSTIGGTGKPENNADVTIEVTGTKTVQVACDYLGAVKSGQLPMDANFKARLTASGTDVTTSATWTAATLNGTATYTIGSATGTLNVTALSVDAVIQVTGTYLGKTPRGTLTLIRNLDPPPTSGGSGNATSDSTSTISQTSASTYGAANTRVLTAKAGVGGKVTCTFPATFNRTTNGPAGAFGKWLWRVVGGTFADITTEIASTVNAVKSGAPEPSDEAGSIVVNMEKTGLTDNVAYEFQLLLRSSDPVTLNHFGTASAVGS